MPLASAGTGWFWLDAILGLWGQASLFCEGHDGLQRRPLGLAATTLPSVDGREGDIEPRRKLLLG